ncbi:hypothetical protein POM88_022549 [Heracleum sosnowskyi]|uniref:Uncharacterized protein n=1 Tax=Heracleum sosnowskyi TaxID=360622 RepID=A0AAD8MTR8_9APIA|nr:hypothetical protein POM88_022549 [Heracleum sosnowskyi]
MSFPYDNIGSRIIFTSRLADLPLRAQPGSCQHAWKLVELLDLRYIAIRSLNENIPPSISNLLHLETIFAVLKEEIFIPQTIWKMAKLRHLIKIGMLPELEVLKLQYGACHGERCAASITSIAVDQLVQERADPN